MARSQRPQKTWRQRLPTHALLYPRCIEEEKRWVDFNLKKQCCYAGAKQIFGLTFFPVIHMTVMTQNSFEVMVF